MVAGWSAPGGHRSRDGRPGAFPAQTAL